jgi:hypothetical protein
LHVDNQSRHTFALVESKYRLSESSIHRGSAHAYYTANEYSPALVIATDRSRWRTTVLVAGPAFELEL